MSSPGTLCLKMKFRSTSFITFFANGKVSNITNDSTKYPKCKIVFRLKNRILHQPTQNNAENVQSTNTLQQAETNNENTNYIRSSLSLHSNEKSTDTISTTLSTAKFNKGNRMKRSSSSSFIETQASALKSSEKEFINILLLGETGVGKSTFINAFVNYLTFQTLEDAESNKPLALIPVSFLITIGDEFTEKLLQLDVPDHFNNEDFEHFGQSVTQQCRSYIFQLKNYDGKKLRIIDTPGFGDTRGLKQDELNIQHIFQYINQFSHLNAVCCLLKPNESRLNISFRTCLIQLADFLGTNIYQKIIFCFTNSRSTFYTPGNTAALLKTMLKSISPTIDILFQKENTFCFDSESFRYLIALKQGIQFNDDERDEYKASWVKSVIEFNRLLSYIDQSTVVYRLDDHCVSIKHAQFRITQMIQPILESIRNCLRNIILHGTHPLKDSIVINPKSLDHSITICPSSKRELHQIAYFWFYTDFPNEIHDTNHICSNAANQHFTLDYLLDYDTSSLNRNSSSNQLKLLIYASIMFSNFLMFHTASWETDLFLTGLIRMYQEERSISRAKQEQNCLNQQLLKMQHETIKVYIKQLKKVQQQNKYTELSIIYKLVKVILEIPEIHIQLKASKETLENMASKYEYKVPFNSLDQSSSKFPSC